MASPLDGARFYELQPLHLALAMRSPEYVQLSTIACDHAGIDRGPDASQRLNLSPPILKEVDANCDYGDLAGIARGACLRRSQFHPR
jgi:hypothetical protein